MLPFRIVYIRPDVESTLLNSVGVFIVTNKIVHGFGKTWHAKSDTIYGHDYGVLLSAFQKIPQSTREYGRRPWTPPPHPSFVRLDIARTTNGSIRCTMRSVVVEFGRTGLIGVVHDSRVVQFKKDRRAGNKMAVKIVVGFVIGRAF